MKRTQSQAVKPARKGAVKARVKYGKEPIGADHMKLYAFAIFPNEAPHYVLPADPESYDAMVEQIALPRMPAFPNPRLTQERLERLAEMMRKMVRQDLAAIGIRRNPRAARATTKGAE